MAFAFSTRLEDGRGQQAPIAGNRAPAFLGHLGVDLLDGLLGVLARFHGVLPDSSATRNPRKRNVHSSFAPADQSPKRHSVTSQSSFQVVRAWRTGEEGFHRLTQIHTDGNSDLGFNPDWPLLLSVSICEICGRVSSQSCNLPVCPQIDTDSHRWKLPLELEPRLPSCPSVLLCLRMLLF